MCPHREAGFLLVNGVLSDGLLLTIELTEGHRLIITEQSHLLLLILITKLQSLP